MKARKTATLGLFVAIAMILSYIEAIMPPISSLAPGIKLGLANVIIVFILYRFSLKEAAAVSLIRLFLSTLLFQSPAMFIYGFAGASLSLLVMWILKKIDAFSITCVSVVGAICHNLGQIAVAAIVLRTIEIGYYMLVLTVTGTVAGVFIGFCAALLSKALKNTKIY
jgi:heptaprenyl diphosphate synthase